MLLSKFSVCVDGPNDTPRSSCGAIQSAQLLGPLASAPVTCYACPRPGAMFFHVRFRVEPILLVRLKHV
eukprot:scaffold7593_cov248-Pinguiococcus_pyrenoidosus.AAC.1